MDEEVVSELEAAVAGAGALLVRLEKYRHGAGPAGVALRGRTLALGDAARRLHRRHALDAGAARALLAEAHALEETLRAELVGLRAAPAYVAAVAAHAAGDQATLVRLVADVFVGVEAVAAPDALFRPVAWRRRGRPRPAADLLAELTTLRDEGLPAEGDDLSPGTDPALPAVVLRDEAPADEPVVVRLRGPALTLPVFRLAASGEYLAYTPRLRAPLAVIVATQLADDEVEATPLDYGRYRAELTAALRAAGFTVHDAP